MTTILGILVGGVAAAGLLLLAAALRIAEHILEDEVKARLPYAALVRLERAIEFLPAEIRDARRAEWEPELASLSGQRLRALWFAHECMRAAVAEAREFQTAPVPVRDGGSRAPLIEGWNRPFRPTAGGGLVRSFVSRLREQRQLRRRLRQARKLLRAQYPASYRARQMAALELEQRRRIRWVSLTWRFLVIVTTMGALEIAVSRLI